MGCRRHRGLPRTPSLDRRELPSPPPPNRRGLPPPPLPDRHDPSSRDMHVSFVGWCGVVDLDRWRGTSSRYHLRFVRNMTLCAH
ncbi:hypothetical protein GUJ93_ZPchr0001g31067 [Zizania palustris]|uniref:Uncharacterized protein n=1 Tax=Zizania palustris TaxID=103762 RepID=A0A8J5R6A7_ZIZPA|nr:hypothetical protein GUJ93_ZPchr0001g31067 [Zizania palustris]